MSDYTPTTGEVRDSYRFSNQRPDVCGKDFGLEFDRWLAEVERAAAEKAWWEACLRIADGENHLDIAHVYQKQNPYLDAALGLTAGQEEDGQ